MEFTFYAHYILQVTEKQVFEGIWGIWSSETARKKVFEIKKTDTYAKSICSKLQNTPQVFEIVFQRLVFQILYNTVFELVL